MSKTSEVTVNTIMTMVVRVKQPMTVQSGNAKVDIVWNYDYAEPEIINQQTKQIERRGIVQVVHWLEDTRIDDFGTNTRNWKQPNE